jgi:hypothetical protein
MQRIAPAKGRALRLRDPQQLEKRLAGIQIGAIRCANPDAVVNRFTDRPINPLTLAAQGFHFPALGHILQKTVPDNAAIRLVLRHRMAFDPAQALVRMLDTELGPPGRHGFGRQIDGFVNERVILRENPGKDGAGIVTHRRGLQPIEIIQRNARIGHAGRAIGAQSERADDARKGARNGRQPVLDFMLCALSSLLLRQFIDIRNIGRWLQLAPLSSIR